MCLCLKFFEAEYDWASATEAMPRRPWKSKSAFCFQTFLKEALNGDARGAREVQGGTSPNNFYRLVRRPVISVPDFLPCHKTGRNRKRRNTQSNES